MDTNERIALALESIAKSQAQLAAALNGSPAPRAQSSAPIPAGALPTTFPNYGKSKGAPISGATQSDLDYYANGARKSIADPAKARFAEKERALLAALEAEIARQAGGDFSGPPSGGAGSMFEPQPAASGAQDDDIPFAFLEISLSRP